MTDVLNEQTKENILQAIPLKSLGEAEDVANVAYFLSLIHIFQKSNDHIHE